MKYEYHIVRFTLRFTFLRCTLVGFVFGEEGIDVILVVVDDATNFGVGKRAIDSKVL